MSRHGHSPRNGPSRTYRVWQAMHQRCYNSKERSYRYCGARGIKVCEGWHDFENFLRDIGECPAGLTLDRKNNDRDYEPNNCRWATWEEQLDNRNYTGRPPLVKEKLDQIRELKAQGVTTREIARIVGVSHRTVIRETNR